MPRKDGTGPLGQGALTGKGFGPCASGGAGLGQGRGLGMGRGAGRGCGLGMGRGGGQGRGLGMGRGGGFAVEDESLQLRAHAAQLQEELRLIEGRLNALEEDTQA